MFKYLVIKKRSGVVMLMSLLLMAALTASAIAVSTVIISTIRQSRNLDNFIIASMAADSGIERGLAIVAQGRKDQAINTTVAAIPLAQPPGLTPSFVLTSSQSSGGPITVAKMVANDTTAFDLLYFSGGALSQPASINDTYLTFQGTSVTGTNGALQVSWAAITSSGDPAYTGRQFLTPSNLNGTSSTEIHLLDNLQSEVGAASPSPNYGDISGFRVQVKVVDTSTSTNETVTGLTISGTGFPSRISLSSTGVVGTPQAQSLKTASVLWQLPSSPFFNYVLFTESDIIQ